MIAKRISRLVIEEVREIAYNPSPTTAFFPGLTSNHILALCEDGEGRLWIGAENQELIRFKDALFHMMF